MKKQDAIKVVNDVFSGRVKSKPEPIKSVFGLGKTKPTGNTVSVPCKPVKSKDVWVRKDSVC